MTRFNPLHPAIVLAALLGTATTAGAQATEPYPSRSVTIIAASPAGGNPDIAARALAQKLSAKLGKPFVIDNRTGAGGNIAADLVAKAKPDGYTLGVFSSSEVSISPHVYKNLQFDAAKDLVPVAAVATVPTVLTVSATVPATTLSEFITHAKANQGKLNYGSAGSGSIHQLTAGQFNKSTGITATHIPFKGAPPVVPALVAGDVQFAFMGIPAVREHAEKGSVRLLGVSGKKRAANLPHVPTLAEAGVKDFDFVSTMGIFAPRGVPPEVLRALGAEIAAALADPEVMKQLAGLGMDIETMSPAQYDTALTNDYRRFGQAVRDAGITAN